MDIAERLAVLGGAQPEVLRMLPAQRPWFETRGLVLISSSLTSGVGVAAACLISGADAVAALALGLLVGLVSLYVERSLDAVPMRRSRHRWGKILAFVGLIPRLVLSIFVAITLSSMISLSIFRQDIYSAYPSARGHLLQSFSALQVLEDRDQSTWLAVLSIEWVFILIQLFPVLMSMLRGWVAPTAYDDALSAIEQEELREYLGHLEVGRRVAENEALLTTELSRLQLNARLEAAVLAESVIGERNAPPALDKMLLEWRDRVDEVSDSDLRK